MIFGDGTCEECKIKGLCKFVDERAAAQKIVDSVEYSEENSPIKAAVTCAAFDGSKNIGIR
jgi:hypothetical protein